MHLASHCTQQTHVSSGRERQVSVPTLHPAIFTSVLETHLGLPVPRCHNDIRRTCSSSIVPVPANEHASLRKGCDTHWLQRVSLIWRLTTHDISCLPLTAHHRHIRVIGESRNWKSKQQRNANCAYGRSRKTGTVGNGRSLVAEDTRMLLYHSQPLLPRAGLCLQTDPTSCSLVCTQALAAPSNGQHKPRAPSILHRTLPHPRTGLRLLATDIP